MFDSYLPPEEAHAASRRALLLGAGERVLIIAPHPDDETLAAGGLIQHARARGAAVRVVIATCGENNPWPQRAAFRRWAITADDRERWSERRIGEAHAALAKLGLSDDQIGFLRLPDYGLTELLLDGVDAAVARLAKEISAFEPTLVVSPSFCDRHPDHNALALYTKFALERSASGIIDLRYRIHGALAPFLTRGTRDLALSELACSRKRDAVLAHTSQMILSRKRFLSYVREREVFFAGPDFDYLDDRISVTVEAGSRVRVQSRDAYLGGAIVTLAADTQAVQFKVPLLARGRLTVDATRIGLPNLEIEVAPRSLVFVSEGVDLNKLCVKLRLPWHFLDFCGWQRVQPALRAVASSNRVCAVIPCYNIGSLCGDVVREAARYADTVIAIDDGSTDDTRAVLEAVATAEPNVHVLVGERNRGKGAALLSAFRHALASIDFDILVTLDGDAQHRPQDIPRLVEQLKRSRASLCIGERAAFNAMPFRSRLGNETTRAIFRLIYPHGPADTQSGFRALTRDFVAYVVQAIKGRRYETELSILLEAMERGDGVTGVAIPTVYLDRNRSSHFDPLMDSSRVLLTLLRGSLAKRRRARVYEATSSRIE